MKKLHIIAPVLFEQIKLDPWQSNHHSILPEIQGPQW